MKQQSSKEVGEFRGSFYVVRCSPMMIEDIERALKDERATRSCNRVINVYVLLEMVSFITEGEGMRYRWMATLTRT